MIHTYLNENTKSNEVQLNFDSCESSRNSEKLLVIARQIRLLDISSYEVIDKIGGGCNGCIFLCKVHLGGSNSLLVALKMILNYYGDSTSSITNACQNEYTIIHNLPTVHSNIIQLFHYFTATPTSKMLSFIDPKVKEFLIEKNVYTNLEIIKRTQFFVFEYHPTTLESHLEEINTKIHENKLLFCYGLQLAKTLHFLRENHIQHRDIKLNNILVSESGLLIIADFGESVVVDSNHCLESSALRAGNSEFAAPEVNSAISDASKFSTTIDFSYQNSWELGTLLFYMAFGQKPFPGYPIAYGSHPKVDTVKFSSEDPLLYPPELTNLIRCLLNNDPKARLPLVDAIKILETLAK